MKRHIPYDFITDKLAQMPAPDTNALWQDMKVVLDREMPEEKKKRRFLFWFFPASVMFALMGIAGLATGAYYLHSTISASKEPSSSNAPVGEAANKVGTNVIAPEVSTSITGGANLKTASALKVETVSSSNTTIHKAGTVVTMVTAPNKSTARKQNTVIIAPQRVAVANQTLSSSQVADDNATRQAIPDLNIEKAGIKPASLKVIKQGNRFKTYQPSMFRSDSITVAMRKMLPRFKGFSAGVELPMTLAIGNQTASSSNWAGSKMPLLDYLPGVYAQYHFNRKLYAETGVRLFAPQYTAPVTVYSKSSDISSDHFNEKSVKLEKLYYMEIPLTINYQPSNKLNFGTGLQLARMQRSVFNVQNCNWDQGVDGWQKTWTDQVVEVHHNPNHEQKEYTNAYTNTPSDSASMALKSMDLRLTFTAGYQFKKFNAGIRVNLGLTPYINTSVSSYGTLSSVKEFNRSMQFYLRYNLFDQRRK